MSFHQGKRSDNENNNCTCRIMTFSDFNIYTLLNDNVDDDELFVNSNQSISETVCSYISPTSTDHQSNVTNDDEPKIAETLEQSTIKALGSQMYITDNEKNMSVNESMSNIDPLLNSIKQSRLQNHKSLILTHINFNSLKKEENAPLDYFKHIMHQGYMDALFIFESKLNDKIIKNKISVGSKFKIYRQDRISNSSGMIVWIRSDIPQKRLSELEFNCDIGEHFIVCMILELKIRNEIWYIMYAYKHPTVSNSTFLIKLKSVYDKLLNKGKEIILLGDLNIDMMQDENILNEELYCVYDFDNIISQPTCFKKPEGTHLGRPNLGQKCRKI